MRLLVLLLTDGMSVMFLSRMNTRMNSSQNSHAYRVSALWNNICLRRPFTEQRFFSAGCALVRALVGMHMFMICSVPAMGKFSTIRSLASMKKCLYERASVFKV